MKAFDRLHMPGVPEQVPAHGGAGGSFTLVTHGLESAQVQLWKTIMEIWKSPAVRDWGAALDRLQDNAVTGRVEEALGALPELGPSLPTTADLAQRAETLRAVQARAGDPVYRSAAAVAEQVVHRSTEELQQLLAKEFAAHPAAAAELADGLAAQLACLRLPAPASDALSAFRDKVRILSEFDAHGGALPRETREFVASQWRDRAAAAGRQALRSFAANLARESVQRARATLEEVAEQLRRRSAEFLAHRAGVLAVLEARAKEAAERNRSTRTSVSLLLEGPDANQLIAGMVERNGCGTAQEFGKRLLAQFEQRLREFARAHLPALDATSASLVKLFLEIEPQQLADQFAELVGGCLGGGHTLYELIERRGITSCADFLYDRAGSTCHLGARNGRAFNMQTTEVAVVRLPPALGPRDPEIRDRLRKDFERRGPCIVVPGAHGEHAVTVVRLELGWYVGVEQSNLALLQRYLQSGDEDHLPHLVGVLPESPLGEVCPSCRGLLNGRP